MLAIALSPEFEKTALDLLSKILFYFNWWMVNILRTMYKGIYIYFLDCIILRIPVLYGDEEYMGESAVSSLIKNLQNEEPVKVSNYEVRFPSHTEDIATICFNLVERRLKVSRNYIASFI